MNEVMLKNNKGRAETVRDLVRQVNDHLACMAANGVDVSFYAHGQPMEARFTFSDFEIRMTIPADPIKL